MFKENVTNSERTLKTLKDIDFREEITLHEKEKRNWSPKIPQVRQQIIKDKIKQEVIKWVKEDIKWINNCKNDLVKQELIIYMYQWMKRLNITEEDLK